MHCHQGVLGDKSVEFVGLDSLIATQSVQHQRGMIAEVVRHDELAVGEDDAVDDHPVGLSFCIPSALFSVASAALESRWPLGVDAWSGRLLQWLIIRFRPLTSLRRPIRC